MKGKIAIVGYGETPVSRGRDSRGEVRQGWQEYMSWAAELALKSCGLSKKDLDGQGLAVTRTMVAPMFLGGEVAETLGITPKLTITSDHGGASGAAMLTQAGFAVCSGAADYVLCVAAEAPMSVGGFVYPSADGHRRDYENPFGVMGPNSVFAMAARRYIHQYGLKPQQTGQVALTQRLHANLNPNAYFFKQQLTMEDYLNSRMIADPFRLLDCVMPVNGGLAFVVTTSERARKMTDKPVYLLGYGECDNYYQGRRSGPDLTYMGMRLAARDAFKMAGAKPQDMNFFQPYDDYTIAVLLQLEEAGFCEKGKSGEFVEKTDITYKGKLPINTGGGQVSCGQPGLAGGLTNIVEALRQLRNEGDKRQVKGCKIGMATGIGALEYARNVNYNISLILGTEV